MAEFSQDVLTQPNVSRNNQSKNSFPPQQITKLGKSESKTSLVVGSPNQSPIWLSSHQNGGQFGNWETVNGEHVGV